MSMQSSASVISFRVFVFFYGLAFLILTLSCNRSKKAGVNREEFTEITQFDGELNFNLDSLRIHSYKDGSCSIIASIILPDSVYEIDSGAVDTEYFYLPLVTSQESLIFLDYPKAVGLKIQPELMEVKSTSGMYYYLAKVTRFDTAGYPNIFRTISPLTISYHITNPKEELLYFPARNKNRATAYFLSIDSNRTLRNAALHSAFDNSPVSDFHYYPAPSNAGAKTYVTHYGEAAPSLLSVNVGTEAVVSMPRFITKIIIALIAVVLIVIIVKARTYYGLLVAGRNPYYKIDRRIKKIMSTMSKSITQRSTILYSAPGDKSLRFKIKEASKIEIDQAKEKAIADDQEYNVELLDRLMKIRQSQSEHSKMPELLIPVPVKIVMILVILLLSWTALSARQTPKDYLVDDMQVYLYPTFQNNGNLDLKARLSMLVTTWKKSTDPIVSFEILSKRRSTSVGAYTWMPNDVRVTHFQGAGHNQFTLTSRHKREVTKKEFMNLHEKKNYIAQIAFKSKPIPTYQHTELTVPLSEYYYENPPQTGQFNWFPFDRRTVTFYLKANQVCHVHFPIVDPAEYYATKSLQLCVEDSAGSCVSENELTEKQCLRDGSTMVITTKLNRSWIYRFLIPSLLLVVAVVAAFIATRDKESKWAPVVNVGSGISIAAIYLPVVTTVGAGVPNITTFDGFTLFDGIAILSYLLFIVLYFVFLRRKKKNG